MLSAGYAIGYAIGRLCYRLCYSWCYSLCFRQANLYAMQLRYFLLILSTVCQASPSWRSGKSPQSFNLALYNTNKQSRQEARGENKAQSRTKSYCEWVNKYTYSSAIALASVRFSLLNFGSESPLTSIRLVWVEDIFATLGSIVGDWSRNNSRINPRDD